MNFLNEQCSVKLLQYLNPRESNYISKAMQWFYLKLYIKMFTMPENSLLANYIYDENFQMSTFKCTKLYIFFPNCLGCRSVSILV